MPSAVTRQPHIRSPDEVTTSVRPLPTPLLWRRSDSKRRFGVKSEPLGVLRRPHPSERSCRQTEPVRNLTLSNYAGTLSAYPGRHDALRDLSLGDAEECCSEDAEAVCPR